MKIIVPIKPKNIEALSSLIKKIDNRADIIEIWLDQIEYLEEFLTQFKDCRRGTKSCAQNKAVKFLAVCKRENEKGSFMGSPSERVAIINQFLEAGGDLVDVDITQNELEDIQKIDPQKLVLSFHDFNSVPDNLEGVWNQMQQTGPAIYKFAVTVNTNAALKKIIDFAVNLKESNPRDQIIFTTMGKFGLEGRKQLREQDLTWGGFYAIDVESRTASGQAVLPRRD